MSPAPRRLVGLTTALVLAASGSSLLGAGPAHADAAPAGSPSSVFAGKATTVQALPVAGAVDSSRQAPRRAEKSSWPVRSGKAILRRPPGVTPQGGPQRMITRALVGTDVARKAIYAKVELAEAGTTATNSRLRISLGHVKNVNGTRVCTPTQNSSVVDLNSADVNGTGGSGNPAYKGRTIKLNLVKFKPAASKAWDCAQVVLLSGDEATVFDGRTGPMKYKRDLPKLSFKVANKNLKRSGFTRVPVKISNSARTIANAPHVRLTWKTKGVAVKGNRKVGTIKPGHFRKGAIYVKDTRRGTGTIVLTAHARNYKKSIKLTVKPR